VIEAESQAVLNTLTEHDIQDNDKTNSLTWICKRTILTRSVGRSVGFQDAFKKWQKFCEQCICAEEDYFEGDGPKLVFDQMAAPVPRIIDGSLY
jgi:hypothetical protein